MWKLNNMLLNNQWVKEEIKREIKDIEVNDNGNTTYQNVWDVAKTVLRDIHSDKCLHSKKLKISHKQPNFIPQETRKRTNEAQT